MNHLLERPKLPALINSSAGGTTTKPQAAKPEARFGSFDLLGLF